MFDLLCILLTIHDRPIDFPAYITAVATAMGVLVAFMGLDAWKKQLKGKTDYELARRLLKAAYKLRNALSYVRNPWIPLAESIAALEAMGYSKDDYSDHRKSNGAVYTRRWEKVKEASADLDLEALEAEVSWGNEAAALLTGLYRLRGRLLQHVDRFIQNDEHLQADRDVLYEHGEDDSYTKEVQAAISKFEDYLRPHLNG